MAAAAASSSSNSNNSHYEYDVFLSFRGEDSRRGFTDHLYTALSSPRIRTFRDDQGIKRGEYIETEIERGIKGSKMSLVVFSEGYTSSSWCLDELVMIMEHSKVTQHIVLPIFYHTDPSHVFNSMQAEVSRRCFFCGLIKKRTDKERVKKWKEALTEIANHEGFVLGDRYESLFIQDIVRKVREILKYDMLHVPSYVVGINSRLKDINTWLQDESNDIGIGMIYGVGGVGKTTIAKFALNLNYGRFDSWSFLGDITEASKQYGDLSNYKSNFFQMF